MCTKSKQSSKLKDYSRVDEDDPSNQRSCPYRRKGGGIVGAPKDETWKFQNLESKTRGAGQEIARSVRPTHPISIHRDQ